MPYPNFFTVDITVKADQWLRVAAMAEDSHNKIAQLSGRRKSKSAHSSMASLYRRDQKNSQANEIN
jgi:hypothetical protein